MKQQLSIGIIGGHPDTARHATNALRELEQSCGIKLRLVKISCSRERSCNAKRIKDKIVDCQLIFLFICYSGHDIPNIVRQLKRRESFEGRIIPISHSLGRTGLIRMLRRNIRAFSE
jgi:hypothetical protein